MRNAAHRAAKPFLHRFFGSKTKSFIPTRKEPPPLAFAFDIDGVLLRGSQVLPAARRALNMLEGNNPFQRKIPYILLTNGGGVEESERCEKLSAQLGHPITPGQYCQAHTVLKKFSHEYSDKPVLVLGGQLDKVRQVAIGYGYRNVYTTLDVLAWNPAVWPFHTLTDTERNVTRDVDFSKTQLSAIFVYHDPRNWALDVQVACDVILSGGMIGGPYKQLDQQQDPVELFFCNPDLLWKSDFDKPRLGQGAFKAAFQAVFKEITGSEYPYVQLGKPTHITYSYAKHLLEERVRDLYDEYDDTPSPHIYMIGDNPESDIAGANAAKWSSVLVKTGVYDPNQGAPSHSPTYCAEDVEEAVKWAINLELMAAGGELGYIR